MSDAQELFSGLRQTLVDQGVKLPDAWQPEPETPVAPIVWHRGHDMAGGALFEQDAADRRMGAGHAGGMLALGGMDIRRPQM
jgi:hypothetical protein